MCLLAQVMVMIEGYAPLSSQIEALVMDMRPLARPNYSKRNTEHRRGGEQQRALTSLFPK